MTPSSSMSSAARPPVDLSVVVCTRNRSQDVRACLDALAEHLPPSEQASVEVIVVDNGSTDDTPAVVDAARGGIADLHYVLEEVPGLSVARNRGLDEASGSTVAFLDDDATIRPGWAEAIVAAADGESVVGVAGRIILAWPSGRAPSWYSRRMDGWFTQLDLGDEPFDLPDGETPWGASMAVPRSVGLDVGGFRTDLGRIGTSLLSGEEADFFDRVRRAAGPSGRLVYAPDAVVDHHVQPERVSLRWVARRALNNGKSLVVTADRDLGRAASYREAASAAARALAKGWGPAIRAVRSGDGVRRELAAEITARFQPLGAAGEHLRRARRG